MTVNNPAVCVRRTEDRDARVSRRSFRSCVQGRAGKGSQCPTWSNWTDEAQGSWRWRNRLGFRSRVSLNSWIAKYRTERANHLTDIEPGPSFNSGQPFHIVYGITEREDREPGIKRINNFPVEKPR